MSKKSAAEWEAAYIYILYISIYYSYSHLEQNPSAPKWSAGGAKQRRCLEHGQFGGWPFSWCTLGTLELDLGCRWLVSVGHPEGSPILDKFYGVKGWIYDMREFGSSRILQFTMFIQLVCHLLANPVVECAAIFRDFLESAILDLLHSTYNKSSPLFSDVLLGSKN